MKRILALILAVCTVVSLLTACGSEEQPLTTQKPDTQNNATMPDSVGIEDILPSIDDKPAPTEEAPKTTIAEEVLFEENGIKITVTGMSYDDVWGAEINFLVENDTDKNIAFSGDNFIVNGITMYGFLYIDVAAGKKANDSLTLDAGDLEIAGITDIATVVAADAHIFNTDTYDTICTVPFAIETSASATYTQTIDETGDVLYDENGVTVIAKIFTDSFLGHTVRLLVKNNTGEDILASADNVSVNGFTVNAWMHNAVYADTVRYCELDIFASDLEENGIDVVEDVTFTLEFISAASYDTITKTDELQVFVGE